MIQKEGKGEGEMDRSEKGGEGSPAGAESLRRPEGSDPVLHMKSGSEWGGPVILVAGGSQLRAKDRRWGSEGRERRVRGSP